MKTKEFDLYPSKRGYFKRTNEKLSRADISEINKQLIRDFQNYLFSSGSGEKRVAKLTAQFINMFSFKEANGKVISINLDNVTRKDVLNIVAYINRIDRLSEATKSDYRRCIKQFFKWFQEEDVRVDSEDRNDRIEAKKLYSYIEKELSISYKKKQIDPSTILSDEEIENVVRKGCRSIKEKAFIKFLHETGIRAGEMLNLHLKHIEIKKNIGVAYVDGKTGRRAVQFTRSMPYIVQWLESHPFKDDNDSFLWLGESPNRLHQPLIHRGSQKMIDRCFERSGIKKKHNFHWFRHSRASLLAPHLPESLLCKYMGWTIGSRQVKTYLHLCPQQLEDAFLKMNGLAEEVEKKELPKQCGCGTINDSFSRYCFRCGNPLSVETALQDQEIVKSETGKAVKEMLEMFKDPEILNAFMKFKEQII
ncbi:tyrosine-type recombinase/integrase [archaeon]|jgi:site-specific recombinase XerD|nr:tyrosine-type recombinase/integrase [archaeon]MBT7192675.1 tyrosine-type recombinase/integrase [archaeon]MBT7297857.1 tyrosine-type recombinase/integrase [archaeon]